MDDRRAPVGIRMLGRSARTIVGVVAAMALLTSCTPVSSAYVWNDEGTFTLMVPEQCSFEFDEVQVRYYDEEVSGRF